MTDIHLPMTPPDCNLKEFGFMPFDVKRLLTSETWILGSGDERAASVALWLESWHQVPAASLPDNDRMLDHLSQSKVWKRVKDHALRGWVKCADGRLYHPVVAEKALEAWIEKLLNSLSGAVGNAKRWGVPIDTNEIRDRVVEAAELLFAIAPQSKTLRKKQVAMIVSGSQTDRPEIAAGSPPDSSEDRNRQGQGQGLVNLKTLSADAEGARKKSKEDADPDFEEAWRAYPKRVGGNSKSSALKAWRARIREGIESARLLEATQAYATEMQTSGNVGTRFVKQAATFFGPDRHYAEYAPAEHGGSESNGPQWWESAGFTYEWEAGNAGCTQRSAHLWRDRRPMQKLPGVYVEPWPEGAV
ncbi:DUF1376 domain-containing protein [Pandoraea capi]|uniref:DUF1376 domain-containing protein n=1 Tax=Pandoraea TaxID=93217 RepID=UPI001F5CDA11|nr:DUF1376 domain-containing protein [Pandoraea capi]